MPKDLKHCREASFTLVETMVALGILATVILQITGVQSNAVYFGEYARKSTQAIWMAKRVMAKVEYYWLYHEFKELETEVAEGKFEEVDEFDELGTFTYSLNIRDWKLPIMNMLMGGAGGGEDGGDQQVGDDPILGAANQILGEELLKVAHVEVFWPEGSQRNSETLTLLLTNQMKVDSVLEQYRGQYETLTKKKQKTKTQSSGKKTSKSKTTPPIDRGSDGGDSQETKP